MRCPEYSKVHAKIQRMQTLDKADENLEDRANVKNRVQALCDGLGVTKNYLLHKMKVGSYRPAGERRKLLASILNLPKYEIEDHFSNATNVKKDIPLIREHNWSKEKEMKNE